MYIYINSEPQLWTVGHYSPDGTFIPESDHDTTESAVARCNYLNGGKKEHCMNLEDGMKDVISNKLEDGTIERLLGEQVEKGINYALQDLFGNWGGVTKIIKSHLESVITPYIEKHDYSEYVVKLDDVLTDILKVTTIEHKTLLESFQTLMTPSQLSQIKVTDLFDKWIEFVSLNVDTSDLAVDYDETPVFCPVKVSFEVVENDTRTWSSLTTATLIFECEHDEKMNFEISLSRYNKSENPSWDIEYKKDPSIKSLRLLSQFDVFLMHLSQSGTKLIIDEYSLTECVVPKEEPEPLF